MMIVHNRSERRRLVGLVVRSEDTAFERAHLSTDAQRSEEIWNLLVRYLDPGAVAFSGIVRRRRSAYSKYDGGGQALLR